MCVYIYGFAMYAQSTARTHQLSGLAHIMKPYAVAYAKSQRVFDSFSMYIPTYINIYIKYTYLCMYFISFAHSLFLSLSVSLTLPTQRYVHCVEIKEGRLESKPGQKYNRNINGKERNSKEKKKLSHIHTCSRISSDNS